MALPDEPLARSEQYLNRTATGSGTIPEIPLTRIEQYLDYIAKNGGSGGGGGEPFVITGTFPEGSQTEGTVDKTDEEIYAAWLENKKLVFHLTVGTTSLESNLLLYFHGDQQGSPVYSAVFAYQDRRGELTQLVVMGGTFNIQ